MAIDPQEYNNFQDSYRVNGPEISSVLSEFHSFKQECSPIYPLRLEAEAVGNAFSARVGNGANFILPESLETAVRTFRESVLPGRLPWFRLDISWDKGLAVPLSRCMLWRKPIFLEFDREDVLLDLWTSGTVTGDAPHWMTENLLESL